MTTFELPATLTKDNTMKVSRQIQQLKPAKSSITINCQNVKNIDSAGIALLLSLKQKESPISYLLESPSQVILDICNLYSISI